MKHFSLSLLVFEIFDWITSDGPPCIMRGSNVFAQSYQVMGEELANQRRLEMESSELLPELQLLFILKLGMDRRR